MFGKSDLVSTLSRDLARARDKRDALASDVTTLTAKAENERRERERAASEIEGIKNQVRDRYLAFASLPDPESGPPCAHASARAREIIEEFSLGSIASPVRYNGVARSPLSYRSRRRRSWSGWCGNRAAVTTLSIWGQRSA